MNEGIATLKRAAGTGIKTVNTANATMTRMTALAENPVLRAVTVVAQAAAILQVGRLDTMMTTRADETIAPTVIETTIGIVAETAMMKRKEEGMETENVIEIVVIVREMTGIAALGTRPTRPDTTVIMIAIATIAVADETIRIGTQETGRTSTPFVHEYATLELHGHPIQQTDYETVSTSRYPDQIRKI